MRAHLARLAITLPAPLGRTRIRILSLLGGLAVMPILLHGVGSNVEYLALVRQPEVRRVIFARELVRRADLERLTRRPGALALYQEALAAEPANVRALVGLGELTLAGGETARAAGLFAEALDHAPRQVRGRIGLGGALLRLGQGERAASLFEAAMADDPHQARDPDGGFSSYERIIGHYWAVQDDAPARAWIQRARVAYPELSAPAIYELLGHVRAGERERAQRAWCDAARRFPADAQLAAVREVVFAAGPETGASGDLAEGCPAA